MTAIPPWQRVATKTQKQWTVFVTVLWRVHHLDEFNQNRVVLHFLGTGQQN